MHTCNWSINKNVFCTVWKYLLKNNYVNYDYDKYDYDIFEPLHSDPGSVKLESLETCKSSMSSSVLCVRYVSNCFRFAEFLISIYQTKFNLN